MTSPSFAELPDSLLTDILSRASGISQQQEQQQENQAQQYQEEASAASTRQQQRYLCGIFTCVNHRWRGAALSICTGLDVSLKDLNSVKQLSCWLERNGNQLQHLSLTFFRYSDYSRFCSTPSSSFLSIIPRSTPQAAAWGGLTRLTSLEVDWMIRFGPPMQYLDSVEELSVSRPHNCKDACKAMQSNLPRLRLIRLPASRFMDTASRTALDILSGKQQLQQVDGMKIYAHDLNHAAVGLFYPSLEIVVLSTMAPVERWLQEGGGVKLVNLVLSGCRQPCGSVLAKLQGLPQLRQLELDFFFLGALGVQDLQQLTQITRLDLMGCSPCLTSLAQLPPQLRELSMDECSYTGQLQQQIVQHEAGPTSTSYLQQLSCLTYMRGADVSDAALRDISCTLLQLQKLDLSGNGGIATGSLACLSALPRLTSLTLNSMKTEGLQRVEIAVLSTLTSLQHFAVCLPVPAWALLCLLEFLPRSVPAIEVSNNKSFEPKQRSRQQVRRLACNGGFRAFIMSWHVSSAVCTGCAVLG